MKKPYNANASVSTSRIVESEIHSAISNQNSAREYVCRHISGTASVNRDLKKAPWEIAETVEYSSLLSGGAGSVNSEAAMLWDDCCIYLRVVCYEPIMEELRATSSESQAIWEGDSIEFFVDVHGKAESYFQLIVDPENRVVGIDDSTVEWNSGSGGSIVGGDDRLASGSNVEIGWTDGAWIVYLALPFEVLGVDSVTAGDHWRMNLLRNRPARGTESESKVYAWSPTFGRNPHIPKRFGVLFFADEQGNMPEDSRQRVVPMSFGYRSRAQAIHEVPRIVPQADRIEELLTGPFWEEPPGWLMTFIVWPEKRPMIESDFEGQLVEPADLEACGLPSGHIYYRNEDTMMATGAFLGGLARKLAVREDEATRRRADHCVRGLFHVYELGQEIERGFTPKPYGGKCSKQFSPDNFDNYYIGLGQYYPLADEAHKRLIEEVICESASYWIRHKHACPFPYFDYGMWDNENDPDPSGHWPLFWLPLYRLAYDMSGDAKYQREYCRLADKFLRLGQSDDIAIKAGSYHRWVPQLAALMEWAPEDREMWIKGLEQWRRLLFELESTGVDRGPIRSGEACARYLGDADLALVLAQEIAELTEEKMIYAYHCSQSRFPKDNPTTRIYWSILDGEFMAETYFAIWDGCQAGIWT